ncbi:MAG: ArnT family glycosyltransferase, partial [Chloroflexota bacterium]
MISSKLAGERIAMLAVLALALAGCALGRLVPPPPAPHHVIQQAVDLVRIVCTLALAVSLLLGPGVAWRALGPADRPLGLGFVPLPGLLMLAAGGAVAWALGDVIDPWTISTILFVPVLLGIGGILAWGPAPMIFDEDERRVVLVVGCVLGLAIARSLWSPGPEGELYAGTVSRTLEVGDRSDSRISYHVVQLVAAGEGPYGSLATELLKPYNFSSRGPLPGLAATPVVLLAGGHPSSTGRPVEPWVPFDEAGFMAYRLAMMSFAVVAFLALWDLVRRVAGRDGGYLAVLLAATTPFLVHEVWFTWPKMLAAGIVLLAAIGVIYRRPFRAGLLAGLGYLVHPGVLLAVPTLGLISLWPLSRARWNRPRVRDGVLLAIGLAIFLVAWRLVNGRHYDQSEFLDYFLRTGPGGTLGLGVDWVVSRLHSVGNTLVPLLLPVADAGNAAIN